MTARLVELVLPDREVPAVRDLLSGFGGRVWQESVPDGREKFSCIVLQHDVESLLQALSKRFGSTPDFSAVVLALEAVVPPLSEPGVEPIGDPAPRPQSSLERYLSRDRRSTDEIYDDIVDTIAITPIFLMTAALSAVIAALAMSTNQTAVVIGAMVIAPLLNPTLAIAMSATVGDWRLGLRAAGTLSVGAALVLGCTILLGLVVDFDQNATELHNRTIVHLADIGLALASGAAGVLALNKGASSSLVGVMIAVALVPPLAAAGELSG